MGPDTGPFSASDPDYSNTQDALEPFGSLAPSLTNIILPAGCRAIREHGSQVWRQSCNDGAEWKLTCSGCTPKTSGGKLEHGGFLSDVGDCDDDAWRGMLDQLSL